MKDVAVIGAGVAGLAAAYFLSRRHRVHLFERERRLGGHTHTLDVVTDDGPLRLDTGFLVHNARTYPNLIRLFAELGVATRDSDMSFSVSCRRTGLEYSSRGLRGFFAQPRTLVSTAHLRLLAEILRFNREAPTLLDGRAGVDLTLDEFLSRRRFDQGFAHRFLLPMASAIWSAPIRVIGAFPARTIVRFLDNHGLLAVTAHPVWKVLVGGSDTYVPKLAAPLGDRIHRGVGVRTVMRRTGGATLVLDDGGRHDVDEVVFACHGDQVLPLLADATDRERAVFRQFSTTTNDVWVHTDGSLLPRRRAAGASWNYVVPADPGAPPTVTYDLNRLQHLETRRRYCVTLNPAAPPAESQVLARLRYRHPQFDQAAIRAQSEWHTVSGRTHTHYCGAYWGYGFHEDGLTSALRVARSLGVTW